MATSSLKDKVLEECSPDLIINGETYPSVKLDVLKNLCSDVLLERDF